jgi:hypothetical protein
MAVIVQADPYQFLMRKIGYSVGLEAVIARSAALVHLYVRERKVTLAAWRKLVSDEFGREETRAVSRKSPYQHIADFFGTINLLKLSNQQATPLHGLEALSIAYRSLADDEQRLRAHCLVILTYLLEADGDILLNLLASKFEEAVATEMIATLVRRKREQLSKAIKHPALQRRIFEVVGIKTQTQPKRIAHSETGLSRFARRSEPLSSSRRTSALSMEDDLQSDISADYIAKALQTRKGWAREIGLFEEKALTESGRRLLDSAKNLGLLDNSGVFLFWPFSDELRRLQIEPTTIEAPVLSEWDLLAAVARALHGTVVSQECDQRCRDDVVSELGHLHVLYREANISSGSIRHQLPLYVAQPAIVAITSAMSNPIPPLPAVLDTERTSAKRRITFTNIRGTQGGLAVRD